MRVNKAECELLGWSREELLGRPVWQLISSGQQAASEAHVKRKLRGEQPLVPFVREYVRKDGQKLMFLIHENLILSTGGKILGIRSTLLDVTEQNRAESELRRMNAELDIRIAELEQSNRKLNEFVHMVSHDLQGPLRSISSFAELLRQRYSPKLDDDGVTFLNFVLSGAARMTALIQELLSYSRTAGGEIRRIEVDLNHALDAALENLHESVEAARATVVRTSLPVVKASFVQMMQLFQNLVDNALKYRSEAAPVISVAAKQDGSIVCVCVSDNGIGIPEGERDRVFDLFKRASNVGTDGSGMGLAICQAIVERHNGRIWIEQHSPTEAGSTFSFTIAEG